MSKQAGGPPPNYHGYPSYQPPPNYHPPYYYNPNPGYVQYPQHQGNYYQFSPFTKTYIIFV